MALPATQGGGRPVTRLSVNLNKVALVRNARHLGIPSVVHLAGIALDAGAGGLTVHPRPDERHIRPQDVYDLAPLAKAHGAEFNIEGNPFENLLDYARRVRPQQCTLVPDDPAQFTSDHGWDLIRDGERLRPVIAELKALAVRVSLFMDAEPAAMARAAELGADCIELYTEPYAAAYASAHSPDRASVPAAGAGNGGDFTACVARFAAAAAAAREAGLAVNAGHDLNIPNLEALLAACGPVAEVSIGHALTADALEMGFAAAVRAYLAAIARGLGDT
jgi:pyridoxine 5-phosphate synthase